MISGAPLHVALHINSHHRLHVALHLALHLALHATWRARNPRRHHAEFRVSLQIVIRALRRCHTRLLMRNRAERKAKNDAEGDNTRGRNGRVENMIGLTSGNIKAFHSMNDCHRHSVNNMWRFNVDGRVSGDDSNRLVVDACEKCNVFATKNHLFQSEFQSKDVFNIVII